MENYIQNKGRRECDILLKFGLVLFFDCDYQMLRMLEIFHKKSSADLVKI